MKLDVLHAGLIETARCSHPLHGHKLSEDIWLSVFADAGFQQACRRRLVRRNRLSWRAADGPEASDFVSLSRQYLPMLERWQRWPVLIAFFHCLDAEAALTSLCDEPFLSDIVADLVLEEFGDQVNRGYLAL